MRSPNLFVALFAVLIVVGTVLAPAASLRADGRRENHWPSFRGWRACGVAEGHKLPEIWDVPRDQGVRWKTPIPGLGHSSPVIWGDRLFVTTAVGEKPDFTFRVGLYGESPANPEDFQHEWKLYCLDKDSGKILWEKTAVRGKPKIQRHIKASHANPTPATDGRHVVAFFGSEGLYCYGMDGKLLWEQDLGVLDCGAPGEPEIQWGFASSPIIHDGRVIVQCDIQKNSFLMAMNIENGEAVWYQRRREQPTWGTPTICETPAGLQVVCNGYKHIGGYDFRTGREVWKLRGGGDVPVPTPVVADGLIYITNAHGPMAPIYAVKETAKGNITIPTRQASGPHIAWQQSRGGNYMQTPIIYDKLLYCCRDNGVLTVFEAASGRQLYQQRLGGGNTGFTSSPVAGDGKVYFTSEEGEVFVIRAGRKFELMARNPLGEIHMATPAISEGVLFFRTQHHVVAIGRNDSSPG